MPVVFLLSALTSFCAFKDGGTLLGNGAQGPAAGGGGRVRVALWNADLMPDGTPLRAREEILGGFANAVGPDVLVLYDVPTFAELLKLRDALHLYGYSAVMSNFYCGKPMGGVRWPAEIAILSRYPIDRAIEFDPPTDQLRGCAQPGPFTNGPVVASRQGFQTPQNLGLRWPSVPATDGHARPLPGPGFLTARIDSIRTVVVGVRAASATDYPAADPLAIGDMRKAIAGAVGAWIWKGKDADESDHFLAAGDFGADPGAEPSETGTPSGGTDNDFDGVDAILTQGAIGGGKAAAAGDVATGELRMTNLTRALAGRTAESAADAHSGRFYLWSRQPGTFGMAERAARSYVSRSFPLVVSSSGGTCAIDPVLTWMRRGPNFAGLSSQVLTASGMALEHQLEAMPRDRKASWVVSLDLDDVVIDNSPFLYEMARKCQLPTASDWDAWIGSGHARLMPGAAAFLSKARALAAGGRGRILILTKRRPDQVAQTVDLLKRLGVITGPADPAVQVEYAPTAQSRADIWRKATAGGRRIALVVGNSTGHFPDDPRLPVGGTASSCPNPHAARAEERRLFGPQTPRFGVCYFLIPVHVL